jgi:putative flippase GtrA
MRWRVQFSRYLVVGLASNLIAYLAYLLLTSLSIEHKLAMTAVYWAAVAQSFYFNWKWTFEYRRRPSGAFVRYLVAYFFGYVLNISALWLLVDLLRFPHQLVQGILICLVAAFLFLLQRYWVFAAPRPA